jgi:hypothetical protein
VFQPAAAKAMRLRLPLLDHLCHVLVLLSQAEFALVAHADITTAVPGDPKNPKIEDFPSMNLKIDRAPAGHRAGEPMR